VRHGALAAALALVALAGARPVLNPSEARGVGPLPACRYDDILTQPRGYDDWSTTLVDTILRVPKSYVPPDLVPVSQAGIAGRGKVRAIMIDDLRAMTDAARAAGNAIGVESAYRSYTAQEATFASWVAQLGDAGALRVSARPGHSEHQLGLTIDFKSLGGPSALPGDWMTTPTGRWMFDNAWKFGWVLSYPRGEGGALLSDATCFHYEPWHYRYLGRDIARKVHRSGLTIREYLWKHYTQLDTNLEAVATPTPTPSPTPAATPAATSSPAGSATAAASPTATSTQPGAGTPPADGGTGTTAPLLVAVGLGVVAVLGFIVFAVRRGAAGGA